VTAANSRPRQPPRSPGSIPVAQAMHRGVVTCNADAALSTVARLLAAHRIHAVLVEPGGHAKGWRVVSDRDLVAALDEGLCGATAEQIASSPPAFVTSEEPLARAVQLMHEFGTHHVIVVGHRSGRPVGIVSTLDVADAFAELPERGS